jgi:hypothetical protein
VASGTHKTAFTGAIASNITFANPTTSGFQDLDITQKAGGFGLASSVRAAGQLVCLPPTGTRSVLGAQGFTLTVGGVNVNGMSVNASPMVIGGGAITRFDNVGFNTMSTIASQLTVNHPGAATPLVFNSISFNTAPVTGFYLDATDSNGSSDGLILTINMVSPNPPTAGGFVKLTNGALVNWPPSVTRTWTGLTNSTWSVAGNWSGGVAPNTVDSVVIPAATNSPFLGAPVTVAAVNVTTGNLNLNGQTLTTTRGFSTTGTGVLTSTVTGSTLIVQGDALFSGGNEFGLLTAGLLKVAGNFTQSAVTSVTSFSPSGSHKTALGSAVAHAISIGSPDSGAVGSHFQVLDVSNATGGLSLDVNSIADSLISNSAAARLTSPGVALTVRRVDVSGLILDNTRFILDEQGTFSTENFSNVSFTGFPTPITSTTMLTVRGPGGVAAARPTVKTDNVTFQPMAGPGNFYVSLTSTNSFPFAMIMNGSNQSPGLGGNGPALTELIPPTGVATVGWP